MTRRSVRAILIGIVMASFLTGCALQPKAPIPQATPGPRFEAFTEPLHKEVQVRHKAESITSRVRDIPVLKTSWAAAYRNTPENDMLWELGQTYWFDAVVMTDATGIETLKKLTVEPAKKLPGIAPELHSAVPQECSFVRTLRDADQPFDEIAISFDFSFVIEEIAYSKECSLVIITGYGE